MICVLSLDRDDNGRVTGRRWCGTYKSTLKYQDLVRTWCGYSVTCPGGIEERPFPTCPECIEKLKINGKFSWSKR